MNKESLLSFIKRVLGNGSSEKSVFSLYQLKEILEMQGADSSMIDLISQTIDSIPEAKELARTEFFTEEGLKIAAQRAKDRKRREAEMANRGRC